MSLFFVFDKKKTSWIILSSFSSSIFGRFGLPFALSARTMVGGRARFALFDLETYTGPNDGGVGQDMLPACVL